MSLLPQTTSNTISASSSSLSLSNKGSGQACAACKYQRRKCAPDCILAPYFPHDSQRQFLNAHKLYGVSNITKIIKSLDSPAAKDVAMKSIIIQSDARAADPVGGCYRIIRDLERQIDYTTAQLNLVLQHLAIFRAASSTTTTTFYDDQNNPSDQFLHPQVIDHPELQAQYVDLQDDVSSWVVQDSVMDVKPAIGVVNGDQDLHVEPHHHHHQRLVLFT